jgi:hypothetical protein
VVCCKFEIVLSAAGSELVIFPAHRLRLFAMLNGRRGGSLWQVGLGV